MPTSDLGAQETGAFKFGDAYSKQRSLLKGGQPSWGIDSFVSAKFHEDVVTVGKKELRFLTLTDEQAQVCIHVSKFGECECKQWNFRVCVCVHS